MDAPSPELEYHTVCRVGEIPEGQGRAFPVAGRTVAVFYWEGRYWAIDDFCPHQGASLAGGEVNDGVVACPWHAWRFCIREGTWCDNPKLRVDTFPVRVQGDEVQVAVPPRKT